MIERLELKIMPMGLLLIFAVLMWGLQRLLPQCHFPLPLNGLVGIAIIGFGLTLVLAGGQAFRRAKTTFDPRTPHAASQLVISGVYRYSRNPMYLGFLLILLGWADMLANWASFALLPLFVLYLNRFQIQPEERTMRQLFGADFERYCAQVRRWI